MKTVNIWWCEDLGGKPIDQGFGKTKADAQAFVSGNHGYDPYDGSNFKQCLKDGWAKPAVKIQVLKCIAEILLNRW